MRVAWHITRKIFLEACAIFVLLTAPVWATEDPSLILAASRGDDFEVDRLLRSGINVNDANGGGVTALIAASRGGDRNLGVVRRLLQAGADRSLRDKTGRNAFQSAVINGHLELTRHFVATGSPMTDDWPLPGASRSEPLAALAGASPNPEVARFLLESGANFRVYGAGSEDCGPFYWALKLRRDETLKFLHSRKKEQFWGCQSGVSPLMLAIDLAYPLAIIEFLATADEVNRVTRNGETALTKAVNKRQLAIVELLLQSGANPRQTTTSGNTALHLAAANGVPDISASLLTAGASLEARNKRRETPLHHAVRNCRLQMANALVGQGSDTLARDIEGNGLVAMAVQSGCYAMIEWALLKKLDIDDQNSRGRTPLMIAAIEGNDNLVRWLVGQGANLGARDFEGTSLIAIAGAHNKPAIVQLLIQLGAKR